MSTVEFGPSAFIGRLQTPEKVETKSYERARLMIAYGVEAFTDFTAEVVATEQDAYKKVVIFPEEGKNVDLTLFSTGLGQYFNGQDYLRAKNPTEINTPIQNLTSVVMRNFVEPRKDNFVNYAVRDSFLFASVFIGSLGQQITEHLNQKGYDVKDTELLRRQDFQQVMADLAKAKFGNYANRATTWPRETSQKVAGIAGFNKATPKDIEDFLAVEPDGEIYLRSESKIILAQGLRHQNEGSKSDYAKNKSKKHQTSALTGPDKVLSSAGCPVAHSPNDGPTGIAMWSEYLADQYEKYLELFDNGAKVLSLNGINMMRGKRTITVFGDALYEPPARIISPSKK